MHTMYGVLLIDAASTTSRACHFKPHFFCQNHKTKSVRCMIDQVVQRPHGRIRKRTTSTYSNSIQGPTKIPEVRDPP
jgi:hypothetical protein